MSNYTTKKTYSIKEVTRYVLAEYHENYDVHTGYLIGSGSSPLGEFDNRHFAQSVLEKLNGMKDEKFIIVQHTFEPEAKVYYAEDALDAQLKRESLIDGALETEGESADYRVYVSYWG